MRVKKSERDAKKKKRRIVDTFSVRYETHFIFWDIRPILNRYYRDICSTYHLSAQVLLDDTTRKMKEHRNGKITKKSNISQNKIAVSLVAVLLGYPEVKRTRDREPA